MFPFRLIAATGDVVARLESVDGTSVQTAIVLRGEHQSREGHIVNGVMGITDRMSGLMRTAVMVQCRSGDRSGQYSIRINQQWRICFEWPSGAPAPYNIEITDYH
jgi:proteic killer suppression protein